MAACVFAANQISKKMRFGSGGNPAWKSCRRPSRQAPGGTLDEVIASLGDLNRVFEEAKMFSRA